MRTLDMTPLFRTSVGFDRVHRFMDAALQSETTQTTYPPYNIQRHEDNEYSITLAVAGFAPEDLTIEVKENLLSVSGQKSKTSVSGEFLHRGIAGRGFHRRYHLADHIRVLGAHMEHGLLTIQLIREIPESLKPRTIAITSIGPTTVDAK